MIGGGSKSPLFLQLIADGLGCPVSTGSGDSLLGAAAIATDKRPPRFDQKTFLPDPSRRTLLAARRKQRGA